MITFLEYTMTTLINVKNGEPFEFVYKIVTLVFADTLANKDVYKSWEDFLLKRCYNYGTE